MLPVPFDYVGAICFSADPCCFIILLGPPIMRLTQEPGTCPELAARGVGLFPALAGLIGDMLFAFAVARFVGVRSGILSVIALLANARASLYALSASVSILERLPLGCLTYVRSVFGFAFAFGFALGGLFREREPVSPARVASFA